ncbi:MAG: acetate--CoA ligase family protein [Gudongella sp.]|nr:acetate--CoA ligase family protein [Gudongella sp.]
MENKLLHDPTNGKLKVLGYVSGSGNTLWMAHDLQMEIEEKEGESPFEIVGIFSSNPEAKAIKIAEERNIPYAAIDIKEFHRKHNAPFSDMDVRRLYDIEASKLVEDMGADIILLAGYVWATTDAIIGKYKAINVHPADLSVTNDGVRSFAGANGVGDTLDAGSETICSSAHIATSEVDGGPLLMRSPSFEIDYSISTEENGLKRAVLKKVNNESRLVGARAVYEIAMGNFSVDENNKVFYKDAPVPQGVKINSWEEDIPVYNRSFDGFFKPKSVVVIGASAKGGIGNAILKNILKGEYKGNLYVINRSGASVHDIKAYSKMDELPEAPDLAILATPSAGVEEAIIDCGEKGTKAIVCITAGFKETGEKGAEKELELKELVDKYNMRLLGPNGMGILNTDPAINLNATILTHTPKKGNIALITQSGAIGAVLLDYAIPYGMGFSKIASLGNLMDIDASDILKALKDDDLTDVIILYLETIPRGYKFLKQLKEITKNKAVIVLKSGRSEAGAIAASSHTGSIAGSDSAVEVLLEKAGAIRVDSLEMAYLTAMVLSKTKPMKGNKIGVVTNAGGPGILITDQLAKNGFELPIMDEATQKELLKNIYPESSTKNPIDVIATGMPEHYAISLKTMAESGLYDALAVVCVPPATVDTGKVAEALLPIIEKLDIPIINCFMGPTLGKPAREVLKENNIACVEFPEDCADLFNYLRIEGKNKLSLRERSINLDVKRKMKARSLINNTTPAGYLKSLSAIELLDLYKIPLPKWEFIKQIEDYKMEDFDLNYPVVAKIENSEVIHKSDVGGVILNIMNENELQEKIKSLLDKFSGSDGVLVQEQSNIGLEMIMGAKYEPFTGHLMLMGSGGVAVELYKDVAMKLNPLDKIDTEEMLASLKNYPLFTGFRGIEQLPVDKFSQIMLNFSTLISEVPEIKEMDLNPVVWDKNEKRFLALDFRIRV